MCSGAVHVSKPVAGPWSAQRPALIAVAGDSPVAEEPGGELQQDLRLGVAAHRAEHRRQRSLPAGEGGRQRVRRPATRSELGRVPRREVKPIPRLWRLMPVVGSTRWLPKPEAFDWMSDTPIRRRRSVPAVQR